MANQIQAKTKGAFPAAQILPPVNPFLGLIPKKYWKRLKDFFVYATDFTPLVKGATTPQTIQIQNDSDFLIMAGLLTEFQTDNTTIVTNPPIMATITDSGSGRQLMNTAIHVSNLFGTAQLPAIWPFPKLIPAGAALVTTLTNLDGTNDRNVRIAYWGFKVFAFVESQPGEGQSGQ
jgi:hypothetical protein